MGFTHFFRILLLIPIWVEAGPGPQNAYYQFPSGKLQPLNGLNCGECPAGTQRQVVAGPYCGQCVSPNQSCAPGAYLTNGQCQSCPCPGTNGDRKFGTSCYVATDGQVTCDCPSEYSGRDCSQCAPGAIQNNNYPYNCLRVNSTNTFQMTCGTGNLCNQLSVPQIVSRPYQQQCNTQCYSNQTTSCNINQQSSSCQTQCPCPSPCPCPQNGNGCGVNCPVIPPWTPIPMPCPGPIACPQPPACPPCPQQCPNVQCPPQQPCPSVTCPTPQPCPNVQCPQICPACPQCPDTSINCPNPCPNPCQPCPPNPPCPDCICPPCRGNGNCESPCPNPCKECPNPCKECPSLTCGECKSNCTSCPPCELRSEECICDPRGTASMSGSQCICKVNVEGAKCDKCKKGYFALSSTRPEGCLACFCSGLTDSCSYAIHYLATQTTSTREDCRIELTNEEHTVVYSHGQSGFTFDGSQASFSKGANRRLFWSLPACMKGDRVTSYGGLLSFSRMCSGSGNPLGADHEVMLVSGSGATVFWTSFDTQKCTGSWIHTEVLLAETAYWSSWKGEQYRRATRADIMEVLADIQLILIRATFTTNTITTSIRNVTLSTVSQRITRDGIALQVESCRCPIGYRGLSCESCDPGYYRDPTDVSRSVFGACKPCPCGKTSEGCHLSGGQVICACKQGFSGPTCQDREVITVTCDPFRIREVEGAVVDFTCKFNTNSKRQLLMRLGLEGNQTTGVETTSLTKSITLKRGMPRVACEIVDNARVTWACVYCAIEVIPDQIIHRPPPPRIIAVIPTETFICINETESVRFSCEVHSFGQQRLQVEWRREGMQRIIGVGKDITIHNAAVDDAGTYICSASDGEVTGAGQIALMVRRLGIGMRIQYPINITNSLDKIMVIRHGGDYPNHPYQADTQADAPPGENVIDLVDQGHPKANVEPKVVSAKPGDTVILRCNASGEEPLKYYWKSGAHDFIPSHVRVSHGALIFRSLRGQDAGDYYCIAYNHLGQSSSKATITLDNSVKVKESIEILHPEISARPGENVNFQCRSNMTGAKFKWSKVGEKMTNKTEERIDGLLTLYRVGEKENGTYQCTVTGPEGTASALAVLKLLPSLLQPPNVTITPKSPLRVRTGSKVRLECEASGNPKPNVTWVRSIDGIDKKLVTSMNNQAYYEIKQMTSNDVGKYACNAVNDQGKMSESLSLVIDDGQPCETNEFRCKSGDQCIRREGRCNGEKDCRDGSDEMNCKGGQRIRRNLD